MKRISAVLICCLIHSFSIAQSNRIWATYYGGPYHEQATTYSGGIATDNFGNVYLSGSTSSLSGIASSGFQNTNGGQYDAFLVKFDSAGNRIWATYYGGTDGDYGTDVTIDIAGNIYLVGSTENTSGISSGGFQNIFGGGVDDAFLVKFDSAGNRIWATYYGGTGNDLTTGVVTDNSGNVYVSGLTNSTNAIASGGFQNISGGNFDAFLVKFDSSGNRVWATYYGGVGGEKGKGVALDNEGNVYLCIETGGSNNLASGGFQNTPGGNWDAFLVKFDSTGTRIWATYYGGLGQEDCYGVATDNANNVFLCGMTGSTSNIASNGFQNNFGGYYDAFLVKFDSAGNRLWATYYGGIEIDYAHSVATDQSNNIFISGFTRSSTNISSYGFQDSISGITDAFITKFDSTGNRMCASYYGGSSGDENCINGIATNHSRVYMMGMTESPNNIASGGFQNIPGGFWDAFLVKFYPCSPPLSIASNSTNILCFGQCTGTATANALSGNPPYTYLWSNSQTTQSVFGLCAGTYTVSITDADGALGTTTIAITQPPQLTNSTISVATDITCTGTASIAVNGGTPPYQYQWSNSNITSTINNLCSGWYYVTVTDANDCQIIDSVFVQLNTGMNGKSILQNIFLFPNPVTSHLTIENAELKIKEIEIYSSLGEKVFERHLSSGIGHLSISVADFSPGIYFITVTDQAGNKVTRKVVKM